MKKATPLIALLALALFAGSAWAITNHNETSEGNAPLWSVGAPTVGVPPAGALIPGAHLLISEVVVTPTAAELIEIINPGTAAVDLSNYYLSDAFSATAGYYGLPTSPGAYPTGLASDFIVKFPAGTMIPAGGTIVVALYGRGVDSTYGGGTADFSVTTVPGSPIPVMVNQATPVPTANVTTLTNGNEFIVLFRWDGASDLVCDVDYVYWGASTAANPRVNKTGITQDGPDAGAATSMYAADTPDASQSAVASPGAGFSTKRLSNVEGAEAIGGNGCATPSSQYPVPTVSDWVTNEATGMVMFHIRWDNPDPVFPSLPLAGNMSSQGFGVFMPTFGPIGSFNIAPIAPSSFFDVFYEVPLADLPPSAQESLPGGGPIAAAGVETNPPCPPDDHWDGNVDIVWSGPGGPGQVNNHFGTLQVCPGAGNSYIHIAALICPSPVGMPWNITDVCPGFTVTLVNEDQVTPAPNPVPAGWTGWICVSAGPGVPVGVTCCPKVNFNCGGVPAQIVLCTNTCDWGPKGESPTPGPITWSTVPGPGGDRVQFEVRWTNPSTVAPSRPVTGNMFSQPFGAFVPNHGPIGAFNVPPIAVGSFFDVFFDIALADLPPSAANILPGGPPIATAGLETNPPCPPDDHWDGNVDIEWTSDKGVPGTVNYHFGTLQVCPGAGNSYIHVISGCSVPGGSGATWSIDGLCPGYAAVLVEEDRVTPAPNPLPAGWTGWVCISAGPGVAVGDTCYFELNLNCAGQSATIDLCVATCDWGPKAPNPVPGTIDWTTLPGPTGDIVRFHVQWTNPDPTQTSRPINGNMASQAFGVFMPNHGPIGAFNVPPIAPSSFFDVFIEIPLVDLPPSAAKILPGGGPIANASLETNPPCPPDTDWDGNVDIVWTSDKEPGQVNYHFGTLQVCPGAGPSYIHVAALLCGAPTGVAWSVTDLCPGFNATLVNEDFSPAPNPLPPGWTGWICVSTGPGVPVGATCCPKVNFNCGGVPATVDLCVVTCDWGPKAPNPQPGPITWTTVPSPTGDRVHFAMRWRNPDPGQASRPITGNMASQEFGVFQPDFGPIGSFNVPPIPPSSFFDVFFDIALADLPPTAEEILPTGNPTPETGTICGADNHWDGNVDVIWTSDKEPGEVEYHFGTLQSCPGGGPSYIHIRSFQCSALGGATWSINGLCPGYTATLVNEDFSPAPASLPMGWTGWICVNVAAGAPIGVECCLTVDFLCGGAPAQIDLCVTTCNWGKTDVPIVEGLTEFGIRAVPNPTVGSTTFHYIVPRAGDASVEIFDASGKRVGTVLSGRIGAGAGSVAWNGRGERGEVLPSGVYFARLKFAGRIASQKVMLVH